LTHARSCQCHVPGEPKSGNLPLRAKKREANDRR
jgi:hypothetical protein